MGLSLVFCLLRLRYYVVCKVAADTRSPHAKIINSPPLHSVDYFLWGPYLNGFSPVLPHKKTAAIKKRSSKRYSFFIPPRRRPLLPFRRENAPGWRVGLEPTNQTTVFAHSYSADNQQVSISIFGELYRFCLGSVPFISLSKSGAKVQKILDICKFLGNFFPKK